jgi:ribosomal protein L21E
MKPLAHRNQWGHFMKRSFREHQALQIARYIRSYYRGTFYIECVKSKKMLAQINKEIRSLAPAQ